MKEHWQWDNRKEVRYLPRWVGLIVVVVGLPIVLISTAAIIFASLNLINVVILILLTVFVIYMAKSSLSSGEIVNRQTINIKDRIITYKINEEGRTHVLINVIPDSLAINRTSYPHKLEWLDGETNDTIQIPLIGMSYRNENHLYRFLDGVIIYQVEPSLTASEL
jgi:hypothetical protein